MPPSDVEYTMNAEFAGEQPVQETLALLQNIQTTGSIDAISLEMTSDRPIDHPDPSIETTSSDHPSDAGTDAHGRGRQSTLHENSQPATVLLELETTDGWTLSDDLRDELSSEVETDQLVSTLYNLSERGLVRKRPYKDDKRKREYQLSEQGQTALENINE